MRCGRRTHNGKWLGAAYCSVINGLNFVECSAIKHVVSESSHVTTHLHTDLHTYCRHAGVMKLWCWTISRQFLKSVTPELVGKNINRTKRGQQKSKDARFSFNTQRSQRLALKQANILGHHLHLVKQATLELHKAALPYKTNKDICMTNKQQTLRA